MFVVEEPVELQTAHNNITLYWKCYGHTKSDQYFDMVSCMQTMKPNMTDIIDIANNTPLACKLTFTKMAKRLPGYLISDLRDVTLNP